MKKIIELFKTIKEQGNLAKLISVMLVAVILIAGMVIGFILPLRPKMSEIEQRMLADYPTASMNNILDGTYFSDVSLWYSDSYPAREIMIAANSSMENLFGIRTETAMVGTEVAADAIPTFEDNTGNNITPIVPVSSNAPATMAGNEADNSPSVSEDMLVGDGENIPEDSLSENAVSDNASDQEMVSISSNDPDVVAAAVASASANAAISNSAAESAAMEEEIMGHIVQNLYVKNGAAYSAYYFNVSSANAYIAALNQAAARLAGQCNVISILVPNQSGAMLPMDELNALGGSNQIDAIHYYYSQYQGVITVDTIDTLRQHMDEYLYFRTDHHWTSLGAYYVYLNYCATMGMVPHDLSYFTEVTYEPFLGSFYSQLQDPVMATNPDYVKAYIPHGTNSLTFWDTAGNRVDWYVVSDVSGWNAYSKYCCFVGGDRPLAIVDNPEINDGSAALVIKESYANAFIPFLVDHYDKVYYMDYRYATENIINFVLENNVRDLIFCNNITIIGAGGVVNRIATLLQ